jgi:malate dehydrogenase (oxaloacetate-decarboxylating)(NADP+)
MVQSMNENPIVFALANPNPEIAYELAIAARKDIIFATGRSDHPNQINNVLGFPYIFRGALDVRATCINEEMKVAAVRAIADLAKKAVPDVVNAAYNLKRLSFGRDYIIPKPLDNRLLTVVAPAVAKAAIASGVARKPIADWEEYSEILRERMGLDNKMLRRFYDMAKQTPKRVVFSESNHLNMLKAAETCVNEGICYPVLLGNEEKIASIAAENQISLEGVEIVNLRHDREESRRLHYAKLLSEKRSREGYTFQEAAEQMFNRDSFGMMMVESGDADALITGVFGKYLDTINLAKDIIGIREGLNHIGAMHIVNSKRGVLFLADTLFNRHPNSDVLIDIARLANSTVKFFAHDPVIAMLSYSNFGDDKVGSPASVHKVVEALHRDYPDMVVDGEMQVNVALNKDFRDEKFPFTKLKGKNVNTLIFPNLSSANTAYKLLLESGVGDIIGPIQMGLNKPVHILDVGMSVRDIVNMTVIAVIDAIVEENISVNKLKRVE